jgi:hypothetical protein
MKEVRGNVVKYVVFFFEKGFVYFLHIVVVHYVEKSEMQVV